MCQGKRIKKKKTSVQKSTLHPVFNEALVFDVPQESVEDVYLIIKMVDYDRSVNGSTSPREHTSRGPTNLNSLQNRSERNVSTI